MKGKLKQQYASSPTMTSPTWRARKMNCTDAFNKLGKTRTMKEIVEGHKTKTPH